jgi:hypothetical protein
MNQILLSVLIKNNAYIPSSMMKRRLWLWPRELHRDVFTAAWLLKYVVISGSAVCVYLVNVLIV